MSHRIRWARAQDLPTLVAIDQVGAQSPCPAPAYFDRLPEDREAFVSVFENLGTVIAFMVLRMFGITSYIQEGTQHDMDLLIERLVVHASWQRKHVATLMVHSVLQFAAQQMLQAPATRHHLHAHLLVPERNTSLLLFFKSLGWQTGPLSWGHFDASLADGTTHYEDGIPFFTDIYA